LWIVETPGPLQGAVHRRDAGVEELSHLGGLPAQDLSQDENGALAGRQELEACMVWMAKAARRAGPVR
jgi:hypothetical protein